MEKSRQLCKPETNWNVDCYPVNDMARANLAPIARQVEPTTNRSSSEFAVPIFLLVELALAERDSKNAVVSFFLSVGPIVCRPRVPSEDRGNWG